MNYVASNIPGELRMLDVMRDRLQTSQNIAISVSFLRFSGLGLIIDDIKNLAARGGWVRILTSTYLGITQPEALEELLKISSLECRVHIAGYALAGASHCQTGFHTKLFIFKNGHIECWVGSSNLTKGGLASNIEANLCHDDQEAIGAVETVFDMLWHRPDVTPLSRQLIDAYKQAVSKSAAAPFQPIMTNFSGSGAYVPVIPRNGFTGFFPEAVATYQPTKEFEGAPSVSETMSAYGVHSSLSPSSATDVPKLPESFNAPQPNPAQVEALQKLNELRRAGEKRAAVVAAPGIGKTFLAAFDAWQCQAKRVLFLSHRLEHLSQAQRTFQRVFGDRSTYGCIYSGVNQAEADLVFATIRSAATSNTLLQRAFDYVVVDEFHHAEAPSYQRVIDALNMSFMLGLTATPERRDGHDVLRLCDYNVAYEIRLVEAINRQWLVPFHYFGVSDATVDYRQIPWRSGGFDLNALENALMLEARVDDILKHAHEKGYDGRKRATVGFCAGVRHARFMADALRRRGLEAIAITGEDTLVYREAVYQRFADPCDALEWLFVADVLNEGVDIPAINSILFLRPTESAVIFIQQLGRGLRRSDDCEVLTVLDFVGHHRTAWLGMAALHDHDAGVTPSSITLLEFTPPRNCEVVLDARTLEILDKIRRQARSRKDLCLDAYRRLRSDTPRPYPLDLWGRSDCPDMGVFRSALGSWIDVRRAAEDTETWEDGLTQDMPAFQFLLSLERDWQQPRVYAYALVWGLCACPQMQPDEAYQQFFQRFPRWKAEYKQLETTKAWQTVSRKLGNLIEGQSLDPHIRAHIPENRFLAEVEGRIRFTLEKDYKLRHGGILRLPDNLVLHRHYDRPEIINYFGEQYDPARHNLGVIPFKNNIVIITKLDTSSAAQAYQYSNRFLDNQTFAWQSQNQQRQDNTSGQMILNHKTNQTRLHLFVQTKANQKACYCGAVSVVDVTGNAPMNVTFKLSPSLPANIYEYMV